MRWPRLGGFDGATFGRRAKGALQPHHLPEMEDQREVSSTMTTSRSPGATDARSPVGEATGPAAASTIALTMPIRMASRIQSRTSILWRSRRRARHQLHRGPGHLLVPLSRERVDEDGNGGERERTEEARVLEDGDYHGRPGAPPSGMVQCVPAPAPRSGWRLGDSTEANGRRTPARFRECGGDEGLGIRDEG